MFPDFIDSSSNLMYFSKLKRYILLACSIYSQENPKEEDLREVEKLKNWFLTKDGAKQLDETSLEIERNFLSLLSLLELDASVSVITFYSKIDYINKKNAREEQSIS